MRIDNIKYNFSKNIKFLRESKNMTQQKLADELNYSDKSISKWENGDVIPDVTTLSMIADYFLIKIDELISQEIHITYHKKTRHLMIVLGSFFGELFFASLLFFIFHTIYSIERSWLIYLYALPMYFAILITLSCIFFNYKVTLIAISLCSFSVILALYFTFLINNLWFLFIINITLQIVYIFIGIIITMYKKSNRYLHTIMGK
jgi:transcriptional regulator with XRE-family HTH domain